MIRDPYAVLGVSPNATEEEIKAAYRRLQEDSSRQGQSRCSALARLSA